MDLRTQLDLTRAFVDIESTTGREGEAGAFIARTLRELGWRVEQQPVADGRFNVYATVGDPSVVLSTHYDCVPPFFASREENGRIYGRGACDAKGIALAQVAAAERLRRSGRTDVALLFLVGEERGSDGAKVANTMPPGSRHLINGEPTDNRLARATRGLYRARLHASGRAAHTSLPDLGESAIEKLVDAITILRGVEWPSDPDLGTTYYTIGMINGGVAPNVVPDSAVAEILFRTVGDPEPLRELLVSAVSPGVSVEDVFKVPTIRFRPVEGFESAVFNFTTDVPFLDKWGQPLLVGPGSIRVAHTPDEHIEIADLERAVDLYVELVGKL